MNADSYSTRGELAQPPDHNHMAVLARLATTLLVMTDGIEATVVIDVTEGVADRPRRSHRDEDAGHCNGGAMPSTGRAAQRYATHGTARAPECLVELTVIARLPKRPNLLGRYATAAVQLQYTNH
ncbi:hypothetical protein NUW58_g7575 [Xylaria curta]|uniref:Uncharacterized protein n=1 Tax=Xylaria curta TaxID=42375 RepID=A0ACC1NIC1_9PEZI|nr:hypothetical protein NUW58_g7575 [Xylaria curta]